MANVEEWNAELLRRIKIRLRNEPCLIAANSTYGGESFHIIVTCPDKSDKKQEILNTIRDTYLEKLKEDKMGKEFMAIVQDEDHYLTFERDDDDFLVS